MYDIKIFAAYHRDTKMLQATDIITPIQVGRAVSDIRLDMQGDDEGDNISYKNDRYRELTAQYWAWKNVETDYYGFMQYRRHFAFREISDPVESDGAVVCPRLDEEYIQKTGLNDNEISDCINGYDVILPVAVDVNTLSGISNEVQFCTLDGLHAKDFDLACKTILKLYPEYEKAVFEFRTGQSAYRHNMFIMKKEIFFDYCEWLFTILKNVEENIDFTYFTEQEMRTIKSISECLLGIYMIRLMEDKPDLKVKHLKLTFIEDTEKQPDIWPAFEKNNIAVAVSCNEYYMPILGVMLSTMLENGSSQNNYDILVLCDKTSFKGEGIARNIKMLERMVAEYSNANIRFVNVSGLIDGRKFFVWGNFTPEAYFRLLLPQILENYEKVLYLDADMVICHDVAELYKTELEGALLGVVRDSVISGFNKSPIDRHGYIAKLGMKNIYDYFQSGVLLINLKKIAENGLCDRMIEYAATHECDLVDQDVLNIFCEGKVKYVDGRWNVDVNRIAMQTVLYAPVAIWKQYLKNRENAYIYHFAGTDKPWKNPFLDKADIFWNAVRKTPWYEIVLKELINSPAVSCRSMELESALETDALPLKRAYMEIFSLGRSKIVLEKVKSSEHAYQSLIKGKKVIFYGAGNQCKRILLYFDELGLNYPMEIWDREAKPGKQLFGIPVCRPDFKTVKDRDDIFCIITIQNKTIYENVKTSFAEQGFTNVMENSEIMKILSEELWIKLEEEHNGMNTGKGDFRNV